MRMRTASQSSSRQNKIWTKNDMIDLNAKKKRKRQTSFWLFFEARKRAIVSCQIQINKQILQTEAEWEGYKCVFVISNRLHEMSVCLYNIWWMNPWANNRLRQLTMKDVNSFFLTHKTAKTQWWIRMSQNTKAQVYKPIVDTTQRYSPFSQSFCPPHTLLPYISLVSFLDFIRADHHISTPLSHHPHLHPIV